MVSLMNERRSAILRHARNAGCNAVAAFEPENVFYLTGFWGEAIAVCTENGTKLIAPKLCLADKEQQGGHGLQRLFYGRVSPQAGRRHCSKYRAVLPDAQNKGQRGNQGNRKGLPDP
jgi:hypothetical protein